MTEEKRKARSIDEIMADIELISQDAEHRDQFKALRMLASEKASSITLPPPLEPHERRERLARIMKGCDALDSQFAYKMAFPNRKPIDEVEPKIQSEHLSPEDQLIVQKCSSVKMLYREFPSIKRRGRPSGFPGGKGKEMIQAWCREQATKILMDRAQARMKAVEKSDVGLPSAEELQTESGSPISG